MTDETPRPKATVHALCGTILDPTLTPAHPVAEETERARSMLGAWAKDATRFVSLIEDADGNLALASSIQSPAVILQYASMLWRLAQEHAYQDLTGLSVVYDDGSEEDDV